MRESVRVKIFGRGLEGRLAMQCERRSVPHFGVCDFVEPHDYGAIFLVKNRTFSDFWFELTNSHRINGQRGKLSAGTTGSDRAGFVSSVV
jgi:hypothetical protein